MLRRRPRHRHHHRAPLTARRRRPAGTSTDADGGHRAPRPSAAARRPAARSRRLLRRRPLPRTRAPAGTAVVVRLVDGDTVVVEIGGPGRGGPPHRHRHARDGRARTAPSSASGPEATARTGRAAARRAPSSASSATSRPATATTGCSPTCIRADDDLLREPARSWRTATPRPCSYPAQRGPPGRARRRRGARPAPAGRACGRRCGGTDAPIGPAVASAAVTIARRAPRLRARRPAADHQLRRPRLEPRRQRRRLRGAARRHRHQRHADGAVPVGPRGRGALPGRGRRRAPHAQRRVRPLPLGPDHPRAVAARRRRRLPPHGRGRVGPRRPRRGAPRAAGPRSSGPSSGASTSATSTRTWARCSCGPSSSTSTSSWPSSSALPLRLSGASTERAIGFPFRRLAAEEGVRLPRPLRHRARRRVAGARSSGSCSTCARASPRSTSTPPSTRPSCGRSPPTGPAGSTTTTLVTRDDGLPPAARPGRRAPHRLPAAPRPPARRLMRASVPDHRRLPRPRRASPAAGIRTRARPPPRTCRTSTCRPTTPSSSTTTATTRASSR